MSKPLRRWGNGFGILFTRKDLETLGAGPGDILEGELHGRAGRNDFSALPTARLNIPLDADALGDEHAGA